MLAGRISGGNARVLANTIWQQRWDAVEQTLSQAADSARSQGCERVLLSSEWLLGALANDGQLSQLASRIARPNAGSVELFLLLRDPVEQLVSHYRHRAKSGRAGSLEEWAASQYLLPRRLAVIRRQLDESSVGLIVRAYGKHSGALGRVFFQEWLGASEPEVTSDSLINPSLTLSELVLLRKLRDAHAGLVPYLYDALVAVESNLKTEGKALGEFARNVAINAVAGHAAEWRHWNAMLPEAERFVIPEPVPDPGSEPDTVEFSEAQMAAMMRLLADAATPRFVMRFFWAWRLRPVLSRAKWSIWSWRSRR